MKKAGSAFAEPAFEKDLNAQALMMFSGVNGILRRRLPLAAKMAFATAGPIKAVAGSPMPPGFSVLANNVMAIAGASFMRSIL